MSQSRQMGCGESRIPTSYGQGYVCCRAKTSFAETKEEEAKLDEPGNADELSFRAAVTQIWLRKKLTYIYTQWVTDPPCAMAPLPLRGGAPTVLRNPLVTPGP